MSKAKWLFLSIVLVAVAIPSYAVELSLGGFPSFLRTRVHFIKNATFLSALSEVDARSLGYNDNDDNIVFVDTRLRLTPQLVLSDSVTVRAQVDVADNYIWGGVTSGFANDRRTLVNSSVTPSDRFRGALLTEIGAGSVISTFGATGATDDVQFFNVRMLHADVVLPNGLGFIRVGRQPFDWGIGLLANGGWDPQSDLGFVLDRFLYLKGFAAGTGSLTFVFVSDRLTQGQSLVTGSGDGWDGGAAAIIYNVNALGGNLTLGAYDFPYIHQTNVLSGAPSGVGPATSGIDLRYLNLYSGLIDYKNSAFRFVAEVQGAFGKIDGLGAANDIDPTNLLGAARIEVYPSFPFKHISLEGGFSLGDDNSTPDFEGGVIHFNPAYNLDNLLFKHIIPNIYRKESSVDNAFYGRVWTTVKLSDKITLTPQVLVAFADETDSPLFANQEIDRYLGTEVEATLGIELVPGVNFDIIGSLVVNGSGLKDLLEQQAAATANETSDPEAEDISWAVQGRLLVYIDQFFKK
ncbi:MAG: hypothetical protein ACT4NX_07425 [Deltaproteobacteria bacterium]